ncbi:fructose-bisphosphate aldolase [Pseudomonas caspiana]|nr:fructose-bisphosphate aldolase [Pseudomonas caspiana]TPG95744.1 fructose-bisphosphate aldolase [Pseudomonas caspiana]
MTMNNPPRRFTPMSQFATDYPVLLIDSDAPLRELHNCVSELHNCVSERLNAVLKYLNLMACTSLPDYAENDINTVTNIARIMVQDVSDVFRVIEQRGFDEKSNR